MKTNAKILQHNRLDADAVF